MKDFSLSQTYYFDRNSDPASEAFGLRLRDMIAHVDKYYDCIVLFCIGTDKATGDSLGPMCGTFMKQNIPDIPVFGTLAKPVHALNIRSSLKHLYEKYEHPLVIAVDASLGMSKDMGLVTLTNSHLFPGKGVNKKLPAIGDISITGIVNVSGRDAGALLLNTRLYFVIKLVEYICEGICQAVTPHPDPCIP